MAENWAALGRWVRAERARRGMTQLDLEAASGVAQSYISRLEKGERKKPGGDVLIGLARGFDLSVGDMLIAAGVGDTTPADELTDLFRRARALGVSPQLIDTIQRGLPDLPRDIAEDLIAGLRADVIAAEAEAEAQLDPPAGPNTHGPQVGGNPIQIAAQARPARQPRAQARATVRYEVDKNRGDYCAAGEG